MSSMSRAARPETIPRVRHPLPYARVGKALHIRNGDGCLVRAGSAGATNASVRVSRDDRWQARRCLTSGHPSGSRRCLLWRVGRRTAMTVASTPCLPSRKSHLIVGIATSGPPTAVGGPSLSLRALFLPCMALAGWPLRPTALFTRIRVLFWPLILSYLVITFSQLPPGWSILFRFRLCADITVYGRRRTHRYLLLLPPVETVGA